MNMPGWWREDESPHMLSLRAWFLIIFTVFILFVSTLFSGVKYIEMVNCHQGAEKVGTTGHYGIITKCYYRLGDGLMATPENYPVETTRLRLGQSSLFPSAVKP